MLRNLKPILNMSNVKKYAAIVLGSGQSGTPLAASLVKAGHSTLLIEREHIGGCCVNVGCTPTKTMIASGRVAYIARRGRDYGVHTSALSAPGGGEGEKVWVDMRRVRERKREIVDSFRGGSEKRTEAAGVELMVGAASFVGEKTVKVVREDGGEVQVAAEMIFINTGERPAPLGVPFEVEELSRLSDEENRKVAAAAKSRILDSTSIQELDAVPEHLIVMGGGYVGLEFAQLFRRLGSEVTVIQRGKQLLAREDADIAKCMLEILEQDGLTILLDTTVQQIRYSNDAFDVIYQAKFEGKEISSLVQGSHVLVATGRIPNTEDLKLPAAGIKTDRRGYIDVNDRLETSVPGIYAMGDVKGPPAFTHISYDDFRIIRHNLNLSSSSSPGGVKAKVLTTTSRLVPYVVYTDPQLGHVGLHERGARSLYLNPPLGIKRRKLGVATMPMSYVARALETDESRGMMKATVDMETGEVLGFTCLGVEGGEVMAVVQTAMMGGLRWWDLENAVWAHPSLAESLNNLWGLLKPVE